eukprot:3378182-Pleurochrysis_carterae.AAC.2
MEHSQRAELRQRWPVERGAPRALELHAQPGCDGIVLVPHCWRKSMQRLTKRELRPAQRRVPPSGPRPCLPDFELPPLAPRLPGTGCNGWQQLHESPPAARVHQLPDGKPSCRGAPCAQT